MRLEPLFWVALNGACATYGLALIIAELPTVSLHGVLVTGLNVIVMAVWWWK